MVGDMRNQKTKDKNGKPKLEGKSREMYGFNFCLLIFAFCYLPFATAGAADMLQDPTRPPADLSQENTGAPVASGPQLQSVRISAHQRSAMINGQHVKVGDKLGDARIVMITESEVVLKGSNGLQTLKLFPDVGKRIIMRSQHHKHSSSRPAKR